MSSLLIKTKLHQPRTAGGLVARARLVGWLSEQRERRLILVIAPAGYGKTTVVSQWLANVERRTQSVEQPDSGHTNPVLRSTFHALRSAWLSLDADDSDLGRCWRYLVAAIRQAYPESCPETVALLESPQLPPPRYLVEELANELADLPGRLILVLDDYHHIGGQTVHEALQRLLAHLPHNVQLVVMSRVDLPWPLGRLRGQGQVAELRAADLRFTEGEVQALLGGVVGGEQLAPAAVQLCARTEGWAVGLQLARMSLRAAPDVAPVIARLRGTSGHIADYLLDEVLSQQPEALQRSLLILAVPERFCQDLWASLLNDMPGGVAQAPIAELERQGMFLVALDDERVWYRFHHLVRDLLAARLVEAVGQETLVALHRRCSAWFAARAQVDEAVRHALLAGDEELAARIVERGYRALLERNDDMIRLGPLLALLPEPVVQGRPLLLLAHALNAYTCWDLPAVRRLTELAQTAIEAQRSALDADTLTELCGEVALLQSFLSFVSGDGARTLALARQAYQAVPPTRPFLHALAVRFHATALQMSGDYEGGYQLVVHHLGQHVRPGSKARASLVTSCCLLDYLDANLERLAGDVLALMGESTWSRTYHFAFGHYIRGRLHYERNELEQARHDFTQSSSIPLSAMPLAHHDSLAGLAHIALAQGDREQAAEYGRLARAYAGERASQALAEASISLEAALALARDDLDAAGRLVRTLATGRFSSTSFWLEQPLLRQAQVWLLQGESASRAAATQSLTRILSGAKAVHNVFLQISAGALLAMARDAGGEGDEALSVLAEAVELAAPRGQVRLFVDCGPALAPLLRRLAPQSPHQAYIRSLLAAFSAPRPVETAVPAAPALASAPSPLTRREQEILELLAERLTDQEIAEQLVIAITTVRTHTQRIYSKLEVRSRRQAIERARRLGLLTTHSRTA